MSISPTYDISATGSLASATLCAQRQLASAPGEAGALVTGPRDRVAAPQMAGCKTARRRLLDALLSPISGPRRERQNSGASNI